MTRVTAFAAPATTFILLMAVGLDLTLDDFRRIRGQPLVVATGLLGPLILLPPVALALNWLFRPPAEVTAGVLLVAACPIGGVSNAYSYLARASTALSVTLTGLSCLMASLTVPLVGRALSLALGQPLGIDVPPGLLITQLLVVLALPVGVGMWLRWQLPSLASRLSGWLQRLALYGIAIVLLLVIAEDLKAFGTTLEATIPLAAAFVVVSFLVGWMCAALVTGDRRDRFTLAAEFGTRNIAIATAIAVTMLGRAEFARFTATYAVIEVPLMLAAVGLFRWSNPTRYVAAKAGC